MSRIMNAFYLTLVTSLFLFSQQSLYADFIVTNMFAEVGVAAGDVIDGVGGHSTNFAQFSISDGVEGTANYQLAEALFNLQLEDDAPNADYLLTYESETHVMTGGEGLASSLSNGILVFTLTEDFEATSLAGDSSLFDSLGSDVPLLHNETTLLKAGNYSVSFGSSVAIFANDNNLERTDSVFGQIAFNSTAIPEPSAAATCLMVAGLAFRRRR